MAVDDYLFHDTDDLVLPSKTLYPVSIPVAHYQLRHYISSSDEDVLFYASGQDVYALNTATRKRIHIATLPFETRCTAYGYGWLCAGGEDEGHFAAIKLDGGSSLAADVDALLPLDLGGRSSSSTSPFSLSTPTVKLERIGEEIVNSISIHLSSSGNDGEDDEVVAVLTNNDKTVRIYNLTHGLEDTVLDLPFPMNHASISPDGNMMVAVGDFHQAFFFGKQASTHVPSKGDTRTRAPPPEWREISVAPLHVPSSALTTGYFTTAWSPSGKLCAVGSECGHITVFDTDLVVSCDLGEDAIVQVVRSTRPDTSHGPGAVRTMCFSPQPWDLLIWSEDQARVCVADLRAGLLSRQVLTLDPKEPGLEKAETSLVEFSLDIENAHLRELDQEADFVNRYRRALATADSGIDTIRLATEYIESSRARRRAQGRAADNDSELRGLTVYERQVLQTLRARQGADSLSHDREHTGTVPRSINYNSTTTADNESRRSTLPHGEFPALSGTRSTDRSNTAGVLPSSFQPRRQASVVLSPTNDDAATSSARQSASARPQGLRPDSEPENTEAWRTIEAAMARSPDPLTAPRPSGTEASASATAPRIDPMLEMSRLRQLARARERVRNMQAPRAFGTLDDYGAGMLRRSGAVGRWNSAFGVRTAGLAMSKDGRKLYAGTEEGIFEFDINVRARKGWPAVEAR
ncbi:hypothetical protein K490DRAFT_70596 [Saccharata proteae CBS 121410]|uniref:DUF2415 domain-containing protein n=1 Tax=Saccharata proteae CBS 121410 TaxID=1314787 RepID=A0A9P4I4A9_9PEZI|nr:hypothetical protein K490DRAFT_70596 [Saccharata proteae CBS 121410]